LACNNNHIGPVRDFEAQMHITHKAKPPKTAPLHTVTMEAHNVNRYELRGRVVELPAANVTHARRLAVQEAHKLGGLPPWSPLVRRSMEYTTATPITGALPPVAELREQATLFPDGVGV
jgi:hypothetical protein